MGALLAPLALTAIAASHPTYDADACRQVRATHELAVKHNLHHGNLEKLEALYCAPRQDRRRARLQQRCEELRTVEWLASMSEPGQLHTIRDQRRATCDAGMRAPRTWDNGRLARTRGGTWYFPNGRLAISAAGSWYWANGRLAKTGSGTWYYPNGRMALAASGRWYDTDGRLAEDYELVRRSCREHKRGGAHPGHGHHGRRPCREAFRDLRDLDGDARTARLIQLAWDGRV